MSAQPCVNHPREQTRVSCSACGAPICPKCMRQSAVGQKCPSCARTPRSARAAGKPAHYVKAVGAALGTGVAGGALTVLAVARLSFGLILFSALTGFLAGRAAAWGAQRQSQPPFPALAAGSVVVGMVAGVTLFASLDWFANPWLLLALAAAGYFAVRGLHS